MIKMEEIGKYAFMAFVAIAIVMGLVVGYMASAADLKTLDPDVQSTAAWVTLIMVILGVIVGLITVTAKEVTPFLIAAIALAVIRGDIFLEAFRTVEALELLGYLATYIVNFIAAFVAPAAVIIAIKQIYGIAKEK